MDDPLSVYRRVLDALVSQSTSKGWQNPSIFVPHRYIGGLFPLHFEALTPHKSFTIGQIPYFTQSHPGEIVMDGPLPDNRHVVEAVVSKIISTGWQILYQYLFRMGT